MLAHWYRISLYAMAIKALSIRNFSRESWRRYKKQCPNEQKPDHDLLPEELCGHLLRCSIKVAALTKPPP